MKRQTVKIEELKNISNRMLSMPELKQEAKRGICSLVEALLHETGNYKGFTHNGEEYDRYYF